MEFFKNFNIFLGQLGPPESIAVVGFGISLQLFDLWRF